MVDLSDKKSSIKLYEKNTTFDFNMLTFNEFCRLFTKP